MRLNSLIAVLWIAIVFWHLSKIEGIVVNDNICLKKMAAQKSYRCATIKFREKWTSQDLFYTIYIINQSHNPRLHLR
jgi:hypothetical protein